MKATEKTLSELIKTMRTAEGLTQSELAEAVYSDKGSICRWEHVENITLHKFIEIAGVLGYTVEVVDGQKFDSKKEANRYQELILMEKAVQSE